jgi:hypothetical protein
MKQTMATEASDMMAAAPEVEVSDVGSTSRHYNEHDL